MDTACFTGHRPDKLNGYNPEDNVLLIREIKRVVQEHIDRGVTTFINGGALGVDTWAAGVVIKMRDDERKERGESKLKLITAAPCRNQDKLWPPHAKKVYAWLLENSDEVVYVSDEPEYKIWMMHRRNEYMVDRSAYVIGVYDGSGLGGTRNTLEYAHKKMRTITVIDPLKFR